MAAHLQRRAPMRGWVACLSLVGLLLVRVEAHGSLTLPVPRNNKGAEPPFGRTIYHNPVPPPPPGGSGPSPLTTPIHLPPLLTVGSGRQGCQGDACLWFNEGCYNGCPNCTGAMPTNTQGGSANTYGAPDPKSCPSPTEPTLPEWARTWNIENASPRGDFTKYHPWRSPGRSPVSDPW